MDTKAQLPPKWVKYFSWCFAYLIIVPLITLGTFILEGRIFGLSAYGFQLEGENEPLHFQLILAGLIFCGSLTAIFILSKRSYAYGVGIAYSLLGLGVILYGHSQSIAAPDGGGSLEVILLICFLVHLLRNRSRWVTMTANKTVQDDTLRSGSLFLNS